MRDLEGRAVPEQVRTNGKHRVADWLDDLARQLGLWHAAGTELTLTLR